MSRPGRLLAALVTALALMPCAAEAQGAGAALRVSMPQSVGPAGGLVSAPLQVAVPEGVEVGSLRVTARFGTAQLTFSKVEPAGVAYGVGAEAVSEVKEEGTDTLVTVTIATPEKDGRRTPIPTGQIVQMLFTIAKDQKPETVVSVKLTAEARASSGGGTVPVETKDGEIIVSNPSLISCFFYMH